jgi:hypothetical protein
MLEVWRSGRYGGMDVWRWRYEGMEVERYICRYEGIEVWRMELWKPRGKDLWSVCRACVCVRLCVCVCVSVILRSASFVRVRVRVSVRVPP